MFDCANCSKRMNGPLESLPGEILDPLSRSFKTHQYQGGELVYLQDESVDDFFFLCGGAVKLIRESPEGKQTIVDILGPCGWFGDFSFSEDAVHSVSAEVVTPAVVNHVSRRKIAELALREPNLLVKMVESLNASLGEARARNAHLAHQPVRLRALHLLASLFDRYGQRVNGHWELGIPLARAEIAEMLGTTPETAIRTLGQLQREGHLQLGRRRIAVSDRKALNDLTERETLGLLAAGDEESVLE